MAKGPQDNDWQALRPSYSAEERDAALDWFLRLQDAPHDRELRRAFEGWRQASSGRDRAYASVEQLHALPSLRQATAIDAAKLRRSREGAAMRIPQRAHSTPRRSFAWGQRLAAAAALVLIGIGVARFPAFMLWLQADHVTSVGERRTFALPDGSQATLNTASAISVDFSNGRRTVTLLDGEAFFDVRHDAGKPFTVAANFSSVEVKGTAFLVRATDVEDTVVLERGAVEVRRPQGNGAPVELTPGTMVVATASALGASQKADMTGALAWLDGRTTFHNVPFAKALDELRRYFPGRVVLATTQTPEDVVSGNYRLDDAEAAIRTLAASVGLNASYVPGGVLLIY